MDYTGTSGDDIFVGTNSGDSLQGQGGRDTLEGGAGNDTLDGGQGDDRLDGGADIDTAFYVTASGGISVNLDVTSAQSVGADQGSDILVSVENVTGSLHSDTLVGDGQNNVLVGLDGHDSLSGQGGDDVLIGALGNDTLDGGANSSVRGQRVTVGGDAAYYLGATSDLSIDLSITGAQSVGAGLGVDTLISIENVLGGSGNDALTGSSSDNYLEGNAGADTLIGAGGDDVLRGGAGDDRLDGGSGGDIAAYSDATGGVTVDLSLAGPQAVGGGMGSDTLISVEQLFGSAYNDTLGGDAGANYLDGSTGDDSVSGGGGSDELLGAAGADTLDGGDGDDTLRGEAGGDRLVGGVGADTAVFSGARSDYQITVAPDGVVTVSDNRPGSPEGADTLVGVESLQFSDQTVSVASLSGQTITGTGGADNLGGGAGSDLITGESGDDNLFGADGADTLQGGADNDYLQGAGGSDSVDGGAGSDIAGFTIPAGTAGTLRAVNTGAGQVTIELVDGLTVTPVFVINVSAQGAATVQGLNLMSGLGDDTVSNVEQLHFFIDGVQNPHLTGKFVSVQLTPYVTANGITGTPLDDSLDLTVGGVNTNGTASGEAGADTLLGSSGDNYLRGGAGDDVVDGGAGTNDIAAFVLPAGTAGALRAVNAGAGQVTIQLVDGNGAATDIFAVTVTAQGSAAVQGLGPMASQGTDTVSNIEQLHFSIDGVVNGHLTGQFVGVNLTPTMFNNYVTGTPVGETIDLSTFPGVDANAGANGGAGNDTVIGAAGSSNLAGGDGADLLQGGDGADNLTGQAGADTLQGGNGNDYLQGNDGADVHDGGDGNDFSAFRLPTGTQGTLRTVAGQSANEIVVELVQNGVAQQVFIVNVTAQGSATVQGVGIMASAGTDTVTEVEQLHFLIDGINQPHLTQQFAAVNLRPQQNGANLNGTVIGDTISGGSGKEFIRGFGGDDSLSGGAGDDFLAPNEGADTVDGGDGFDRLSMFRDTGQGIRIDLSQTGAQDTLNGTKTISNVEHVSATPASDTLSGNGQNNWLWGGASGPDSLSGEGGDDLLSVGAGAHTLAGGDGADTVQFNLPGPVNATLATQGQAQDTGQGSMTLTSIENLSGGGGGDTLAGDAQANILAGDAGADSLSGGAGNDLLLGDGAIFTSDVQGGVGEITVHQSLNAPGADTIVGGEGDDTLRGGGGNDRLDGGAGQDRAVFSGARADYQITPAPDGALIVVDTRAGAADGEDTLMGVESLQFSDQTVEASSFLPAPGQTISGTVGADNLTGGNGPDLITGAAGNDTLSGGDGADTLRGEDNNDYVQGAGGNDQIDGGPGADIAAFRLPSGTAGVLQVITGANPTQLLIQLVQNGVAQTVFVLDVTAPGAATVQGVGLMATAGIDTVADVEQAHFLIDGVTDPHLTQQFIGIPLRPQTNGTNIGGTVLADTLTGGAANEAIRGDAGDDSLSGGAGDDFISAGSGADTVDGGDGFDRLSLFRDVGQGVRIDLSQTGPQDTLNGVKTISNIEHVSATPANDTLVGSGQNNWLWAGSGGADSVNAGGGDDLVTVGTGAHTVDGGDGVDALQFSFLTSVAGGVQVSLEFAGVAQSTGQGSVTITNVENLSGSASADTLTGDASSNLLAGDGGADSLNGGNGNDVLLGDGGIYTANIVGGVGPVTVHADLASFGVSGADTLLGGEGADTLRGGGGEDHLEGGAGADYGFGGAGSDTFLGGEGDDVFVVYDNTSPLPPENGADVFDGGAGFDVVSYARITTPLNVSLWGGTQGTGFGGLTLSNVEGLEGGRGNDNLHGNDGDNYLAGGWIAETTGNDNIFGNGGADTLVGRDGDDYLAGGAGNDFVFGGIGKDIAAFHLPTGTPGSYRLTEGSGADAGSLIVERVDGSTIEAVFKITLTPNGASVTGLGIAAGQGTDTVVDVEELHFLPSDPTFDPAKFLSVSLVPNTYTDAANKFADVTGTPRGDLVDLATVAGTDPTWNVNAHGGFGADTLLGSEGNNYMRGGGGGDSLSGRGGNDYLLGDGGDDAIDGGAGADSAAYELSAGTTGTLRYVAGSGADAGMIIVQRVDGALVEDLLALSRAADGQVTAVGRGPLAGLGTDTLQNVESVHVYVRVENGPPVTQLNVQLLPSVWTDAVNKNAGVNGTVFGDVLDLSTYHTDKDGSWRRFGNGGDGNDTVLGAGGNDDLRGDAGADSLVGGSGDDYMVGGLGDDVLDGGAGGNDQAVFTIPGLTGTLTQVAGSGADAGKIFVERSSGGVVERLFELSFTGAGATLTATVTGLNSAAAFGSDIVRGVEVLQFGTEPFNAATNLNIRLAPFVPALNTNGNTFLQGTQIGDAIDLTALYPAATALNPITVRGQGGADTIVGHAGSNDLGGDAGDDSISAGAGDDLLRGGAGRDTFDGGDGFDRISFYDAAATQGVKVDLQTGVVTNDGYDNTETLVSIEGLGAGTQFIDEFWGSEAGNLFLAGWKDIVHGRGGDDTFLVGGAPGVVDGGAGRDNLGFGESRTVSNGAGGISEDPLARGVEVDLTQGRILDDGYGQSGLIANVEILAGTRFADRFTGDAASNELYGNVGNDTLDGAGGDDLLFGGDGADRITGGAGTDTALFRGARAGYTVTAIEGGGYRIVDTDASNGDDGTDEVFGVELLQFADGVTSLTPGVSIGPATLTRAEGPDGTATFFDFTVTRSGDTGTALTLPYTVTGSGVDPADADDIQGFSGGALSGTVSFAAGATTAVIRVQVLGDSVIENQETFTVSLSQPDVGTVVFLRQDAVGVINNDDNATNIPPGWSSGINFGDPHIVTLDGLQYEMQGVGEFVLVESVRGAPVTVQVRTEAVNAYASEIESVATRLGSARVTIDAERADTILVNGQPLTFAAGELSKAVGDGTISKYSNNGQQGWLIMFSDATKAALVVLDLGDRLDVTFAAGPERAGDFRGLLGNFDGTASNDLVLRSGEPLPADATFQQFYGDFVNSWRITQAESLFDYGPGQTTATFTDLTFPPAPVTLDIFPDDLVAAAEAAATAAGITDPALREAAVKDFLLTGDSGFISSGATVSTTLTTPTVEAPPPPSTTVIQAVGVGAAVVSQDEGRVGTTAYSFKVYRTDGGGTLTVSWKVEGATFQGATTAAEAADFVGDLLGSVTFAPGETEKVVTVNVAGDNVYEANEGFQFVISAPQGVQVVAGSVNATIVNDDAAPAAPGVAWSGGKGADLYVGGAGNDTIDGGEAADTLSGGAGADVLAGGKAADQLTGGAGRDTFVFGDQSAQDTITDFTVGVDRLAFVDGVTIKSWKEVDTDGDKVMDATLVSFAKGGGVLLEDILGVTSATQLTTPGWVV